MQRIFLPIYAAVRAYLENCILRNFVFHKFSKYLGSQPLQKDWTTLELLEVIHKTVTLTKVLRKNVIIVIFKKCTLLNFTFNSCQNLGFQSLEEDCVTLKVLKIRHGNIVMTKVLKGNAVRGIFKKKKFNLRIFAFYNFSENLGFRQLEEDWPTLQLLRYHMKSLQKQNLYI